MDMTIGFSIVDYYIFDTLEGLAAHRRYFSDRSSSGKIIKKREILEF